jgi:hypothetical protein
LQWPEIIWALPQTSPTCSSNSPPASMHNSHSFPHLTSIHSAPLTCQVLFWALEIGV